MDMYNIVMGDGKERDRGYLLASHPLGLMPDQFGRFRDAWCEWDENQVLRIAVYTRNGGGNRADHQEVTDALRAHPCYMNDRDDEFDTTYATYYFRFPVILPDHLRSEGLSYTQEQWDQVFTMCGQRAFPEPVDMSAKWQEALANLNANGLTERQAELSKPLIQALEQVATDPDPSGITIITTDGDVRKENP